MNEGESAGGGHQGFNPDPPAVPDRILISVTTRTTTSTLATTVTATKVSARATATVSTLATALSTTTTVKKSATILTPTSITASSRINTRITPELLTTKPTQTVATTATFTPQVTIPVTVTSNSNSVLERVVSPIPKSFQQAFAQHSLQPFADCAKTSTPSTHQHLYLDSRVTHMSETPTCYIATIGVNAINTIITKIATTETATATATIVSTEAPSLISSIKGAPKHLVKRRKLEDCVSTDTTNNLENNLHINLSLLPITTTRSTSANNNNNNTNINNITNNNIINNNINNNSNKTNLHNCDQNIPINTTGSLYNSNRVILVNADNQKFTKNPQDIQALKKRILEYKYLKLRSLKEKHSENVAELFYLQNGGNMMDYPTWRKKSPTPQFITYSNSYRLDQLINAERLTAPTTAITTTTITTTATTTKETATIATVATTTIATTTVGIRVVSTRAAVTATTATTKLIVNNSNNFQQQQEQKHLCRTAVSKIARLPQESQEQEHQQKQPQQQTRTYVRTNVNSALSISLSTTVSPTITTTTATANNNQIINNNLVITKSYEQNNSVSVTVNGGGADSIPIKSTVPIKQTATSTATTRSGTIATTIGSASLYSKTSGAQNKNLSQSHNQNRGSTILSTTTETGGNILPPQGAEIKIPAVGATPVAVSTKLPAAVQQLTQQGHIPGRPLGGRHGMVFGQIPAQPAVGNSSVPLVPGGTPLIPCSTAQGATTLRRNGNNGIVTSNTPPALYSPTPSGLLVPTNSVTMTNDNQADMAASGNCSPESSYKAKQEVDIMRRVMELQREGLWTEKRLPKQLEPTRPKAHWDYLLEEMVWLAADFAQERKWKKAAAKKCAKMVQKYFQDKSNAALKAEKAQEAHLRRVAAFIAKEVKMFWSNVEKLVEYKHQTKIEEKRKKALDQHLSFIVDQTEKFSQQLAEGMNKSLVDANGNPSINSSRISSPKKDNTDEEFRPESASDDDEETIAKAEEEDTFDVDAEVAALKKESQMNLEDFLKDLPKGYLENRDCLLNEEEKKHKSTSSSLHNNMNSDSEDGEFKAVESSEDDEKTIIKQEAEEMDMDHQKELSQLEADNNLTVDELLAKYKAGEICEIIESSKKRITQNSLTKMDIDSDDDDSDGDGDNTLQTCKISRDSDDESTDNDEVVDETQETGGSTDEEENEIEGEEDSDLSDEHVIYNSSDTQAEDEGIGLRSLLLDDASGTNSKDDMIKDAAALAESLQPKGNTLSSTNVVTPVPFLLKHSLREYQHIGLDWLVTMYERKLNGILADEMGLGKTIQTIALLAHLACVKGNWGPHLIIVPSSVMLNWEMEFKKWCPGFKILTYYGTQKERKMKRVGWTKANAFHVCITSYKLVVQDQQSFRRKKWKYLILDEAQNIKNFKSQRWQLLLHFSTERRLLLTGTPLQNDLMELWSLMHFLMPYVFSSHREFKEWFSNPMTGMIEGNMEYNDQLIQRLHKVIRPFLLRRLKKEVEKQMPKKYEHIVMCRLSNRQRYLYDDFMSRAKTRETLQTGNLLSVINVLMQLRKVCNHPNMFEVRPTISPFQMESITFETSRLICDLMDYNPFTQINLFTLNVLLVELELTLTAYVSHKSRLLSASRKLIEEIDNMPELPPRCPTGKYKFHIRIRDAKIQQNLRTHSTQSVKVGASPAMKAEGNKFVPIYRCYSNIQNQANSHINKRINNTINPLGPAKVGPPLLNQINKTTSPYTSYKSVTGNNNSNIFGPTPAKMPRLNNAKCNTNISDSNSNTNKNLNVNEGNNPYVKTEKSEEDEITLVNALVQQVKSNIINNGNNNSKTRPALYRHPSDGNVKTETRSKYNKNDVDNCSEQDSTYNLEHLLQQRKRARLGRLKLMALVNKRRTEATPIYGADCRASLEKCTKTRRGKKNIGRSPSVKYSTWSTRGYMNCCTAMDRPDDNWTLNKLLKSYTKRCEELKHIFNNFVIYVPSVCAPRMQFYVNNLSSTMIQRQHEIDNHIQENISPKLAILHPIMSAMTTQFPDPRLIQYDCGKLQTLDRLLKELKTEHHRVLIFTQMTKMLDVLEAFLNYHGHIYLRLDGATKVEQRQLLMERFNSDKRIFCFILSTRSGGVGINLTGADTVIFYDSDWNPTMDAQAQDRCHRIGQTRDVHIYRLVSEKTIEVNILKKANQKRMLSDMAIEGGNFTASYFKSSTIKDLFNVESQAGIMDSAASSSITVPSLPASALCAPNSTFGVQESISVISEKSGTLEAELEKQSLKVFEQALAAAEDEQDVQATKTAKAEVAADLAEFDENIPLEETGVNVENFGEMSRADLEMQNLVKQLSPIERYAMRFVEETGAAWTAEQLRAAEQEIEAQKREWEANRLAVLHKEEEMLNQETEAADELLTYSRKDATNQIWICSNTMEKMPIWCPPTPPQNGEDIYIDYSLTFMYDLEPIPESELPPVYVKKDYKRSRNESNYLLDGNRRPTKIRREEIFCAPRSLFDRPSIALARIRRDLKNQRYRGIFKPNIQIPGLKPPLPQKILVEPEGMAEWSIFEDIAILHVLVNLQGLPCNLMLLSPGHTPNWDLVAEIVNSCSKTYRSPRQCRWRYETVIQPREEGKLVESPKKQKKSKSAIKSEYLKGPLRCLRTTQLYANDNNSSFTKTMRCRFDCFKAVYLKKAPPPKRHFSTPSLMNPKHMEVLQEFGIVNYDQPITPQEIALIRSNKLREKQRVSCPPLPSPVSHTNVTCGMSTSLQQSQTPVNNVMQQSHQQSLQQQQLQELVHQQHSATGSPTLHTQQVQIQHITPAVVQQQQHSPAIVLQHTSGPQTSHVPQVSVMGIQQGAPQTHLIGRHCPTPTTQLVKAIVAPPSTLLTPGQVQKLQHQNTGLSSNSQQTAHLQLQQQAVNNLVSTPSSVSVVLTTSVQTMSNIQNQPQHHATLQSNSSTAQILPLSSQQQHQQHAIASSSPQVGGIVHTQSLPQVVSVSQLATVGTVFTTSSTLCQSTGSITTLNTSALRAQRIVATPTGTTTLQDIVLQQRTSCNPSPTVVSMANVGPNVAQTQFQAAQLQLSSIPAMSPQVVTKGIRVGSLQQGGKLTSSSGASVANQQSTHIQLYRQRQQLKVLQASPTGHQGQQPILQGGGQTTLVNAAGLIQNSLMQSNSGPTVREKSPWSFFPHRNYCVIFTYNEKRHKEI